MAQLRTLQTALFVEGLNLTDKLSLTAEIIRASNQTYSSDPVLLPMPQDAPPEIPRIILRSVDSQCVCNVALNRVDLFFNAKEAMLQLENVPQIPHGHLQVAVTNLLRERFGARVARVGIVSNLVVEVREIPTIFLEKHYLKETAHISDTYELQLHALNRIMLDRYKIEMNRWIRLSASRSQEGGGPQVLDVALDVNTLPTHRHDLDGEKLRFIFSEVLDSMSSLLKEHFNGS